MADYSSSPWYQSALDAAARFGVPSDLFVAQIGQESSFSPTAHNGNAYGIAQFEPATAASFGINPADPAASLNAAAQYDNQLHTSLGSWVKALQVYGTTANGNGANVAALAQSIDQGTGATSTPSASAVTPSITGLLDIVTDIPRIATIIVGIILLIIGLAALSRQSPFTFVNNAHDYAKGLSAKIGLGSVAEAAAA